LWRTYGEEVQFFVVYIREAHAIDSRSPMGGGGMPIVEDPVTLDERNEVARVCMTKLALEPMPALVDGVDDTVNTAYAAWPDRLYLVGRDGRIAYRGGPGPFGFSPDELEEAIKEELRRDTARAR
jgi:type I thyroxine 5'-deiodinase